MKGIVEYINEGIFDNNVNNDIRINGIKIDPISWRECINYYQKRRKKYFHTNKVLLGDMQDEYQVIYNEDDCIIAISTDIPTQEGGNVYILCPETIYMNHKSIEICDGNRYNFSLTDINDANDFDINFGWDPFIGWTSIITSREAKQKLKNAGFINTQSYIPETISLKAESIINKHIKR